MSECPNHIPDATRPPVLAVIPARGGSRGIPRKNLRMLGDHPLVVHAILAAQGAMTLHKIVVTTNDEEIATIASHAGVQIIRRPPELSADDVTLDPVVYHAVQQVELQGYHPEAVLTIQPTSPLLRSTSIDQASRLLLSGEWDTVISVVNDTHLFWTRQSDGRFIPQYVKRLNRQFLPPIYRETGGIIGCRREVLTERGRIGPRITLLELDREEAVDIDSFYDWWMAEKTLARRHVVFRVDGDPSIGLGHIYRCLSLASRLSDHRVTFLMDRRFPLGVSLVNEHRFPLVEFDGDVLSALKELRPDIVCHDVLDTGAAYVQAVKELGAFVVNFEDLGAGAGAADLVINSLYDTLAPQANQVWGAQYDCLREEFLVAPLKQLEPTVKEVLVTFGGTDPNDLTAKALRALDRVQGQFAVKVILGLGYVHGPRLEGLLPRLARSPAIHRHVGNMSQQILRADLVITSAGRTVLEIASIGTPCLVLCQNEREMRHLHARSEYGVVNMGLGTSISEEDLAGTLQLLVDDFALRRQMSEKLLSLDVRGGCDRVLDLILGQYRRFERKHHR